jgi:hypothetical protein
MPDDIPYDPLHAIFYSNVSYRSGLMYTATVIHLPDVDQFLASCSGNLVWQLLVRQRFPRRLNDVHLVSGAGCLCGEILEAGGTREFEDEMLGTETETFFAMLAM